MNTDSKNTENEQCTIPSVSGSFHDYIIKQQERTFYAKLLKPYGNHEVGRIYFLVKQHDNTIYSGDGRGIGQGGYVSNVLDTYFEPSSKVDFEKQ